MLKIVTLLLSLSIFLSVAAPAQAAPWTGDCVDPNGVATLRGVTCLVENLLAPLPGLIIVAALIMVIFAGARMIAGSNDPKAMSSAWSSFSWAIVGIILLAGVWLVLIVIEQFTGAKVTEFGIL